MMKLTGLTVLGSTGKEYTVSVDQASGLATCTCPAFRYSKSKQAACKHIRFAALALAASPAGERLTKSCSLRK